jgi:hypothetical protein
MVGRRGFLGAFAAAIVAPSLRETVYFGRGFKSTIGLEAFIKANVWDVRPDGLTEQAFIDFINEIHLYRPSAHPFVILDKRSRELIRARSISHYGFMLERGNA